MIFVLKTLYQQETGNERYDSSSVLPVISEAQDSSNSTFCDFDFFQDSYFQECFHMHTPTKNHFSTDITWLLAGIFMYGTE